MKNIKLNNSDKLDLQSLVNTRLLVQANSGGGKSWLLRRILEKSHNQIQQIIIDLEGEFSTLREKFDYILIGKGGDTSSDPRNASLLAKKLLELNASAIIDLYELHHYERKHFVKLFLESMINAPKELWHPCLVIIDEAHIFCPEKGQSEATEAVIDLATRGRKRGFCAVLATQRLSKLSKDAVAECNNKLIGRTGLDIDMKRASEELGFTTKQQYLSLRNLDAGEFFAFGPALSPDVRQIKIGNVETTHPKAGSRISLKVTPPTSKVKTILKKLGNLPEEAKKELQTITELKTELMTLRRHRCPKNTSQIDIDKAVKIALQKQEIEFNKERQIFHKDIEIYQRTMEKIGQTISATKEIKLPENAIFIPNSKPKINIPKVISPPKELVIPENNINSEEKTLTGGALRMLQVLVSRYPIKLTKVQLATFSKLKSSSGTFNTYLSLLKNKNLIINESNHFSASEEGLDYIGRDNIQPPTTSEEIIQQWRDILKGGAKRMFDVLVDNYPNSLSKEEIGELTQLTHNSGTFGTYLSILKSNNLIEIEGSNLKISENLFI